MSEERELLQRLVRKSLVPWGPPGTGVTKCKMCGHLFKGGHPGCPVAEAQAFLAETSQSPERLLTQDEVDTLLEAPGTFERLDSPTHKS